MQNIKIAGTEYALGNILFTDENIDLFDALVSDGETGAATMKGMRRVLEESLIDGNGEEKAAEAMKSLKFSFGKDSDLIKALTTLGNQVKGLLE